MWGSKSDMIKGFSRQEYCSGLPCPPPGDVPDPGIEPGSLALQADSWPSEPPGKPLWSRELWSSQALYKTSTINIWSCVELKHTKTSKKTTTLQCYWICLLVLQVCVCMCVCVVWGEKLESSYPTVPTQSMSSRVPKTQLAPIIIFLEWTLTVAQSCLILCDPMDCSPLGSSVHGILQARIPEWVAIPFSRGSFWLRDQTQFACIGRQILCHLNHEGSPWCLLTHGLLQDWLAPPLWVNWMCLPLGLHNEAWYHLCFLWLGFHLVLLKSNLWFRHFKYNNNKKRK